MIFETLIAQMEDGLCTITFQRPEKRNALSPELIEELTAALEHARRSPHCGAIILTGAGSAFCAGLDLQHLETLHARSQKEHRMDSERIARLLRTLYDTSKPTIAAVNGAAIAGGMGIATLCDFTIAVPEAKFGYTEVRIGFIPAIVSVFLRRQIGDKLCRDLLLTGRILSADEARQLGLVNRIVEPDALLSEAKALGQSLLRNSPAAMQHTKRLISAQMRRALDCEIEEAITANAEARATEDFKEGIRAFLEKRVPEWPSRPHGTQ